MPKKQIHPVPLLSPFCHKSLSLPQEVTVFMPNIIFTPDEQQRLPQLARKFASLAAPTSSPLDYGNIRSFIANAFAKDLMKRDVFGFNPLITAMETAVVLGEEMKLDALTMAGCLLAPFIEADACDADEVNRLFGKEIASIAAGLKRVKELYAKTPAVETENFRNLLVSFAQDMRVVLIMIADRLATMRRIRDVEDVEARNQVAREAEFLYAPIAHKLGLYKIKSELEDLAVKYLEHDAYYLIREKLNATKSARDAYIADFIEPISRKLTEAGLVFHIKGRTKSIHSILQKMKRQHCNFEGVYDLFAIRIIIECAPDKEKMLCWQVYSIITDMYQPNPKRLRDWLSVPKSNGYESLHITVLGPQSKWVEVQIRTERMDTVAEYGLAAHWRYKGIKGAESGLDEWISEIRSTLETNDEVHFISQLKRDLKDEEIYVFTPKGDLYKLPAGATVLDFAYRIHTNIGNRCVGAAINGKNVPLRYKLASGDQVEIKISNTQTPNSDWLNYVATSRAKSKIRQALHEAAIKEGQFAREAFERRLKNRDIPWDESIVSHIAKKAGYKEHSEFFKAMAGGNVQLNDVAEQYEAMYRSEHEAPGHAPTVSANEFNFSMAEPKAGTGQNQDVLVLDSNLKGVDYTLAKCCHPIYGDDVFGFVTSGGGVKIHRCNCPNAPSLRERYGYRIINARWAGKGGEKYIITLRVIGNDDIGIVNNMTSIIDKEADVLLRSIRIDTADGLFSGILTVATGSIRNVELLVKKLKTVHGVKSVVRV